MNDHPQYPSFAVVGHPNKGKSSIVSTLTRQDSVAISELSGTTTQSQSFNLDINGRCIYSLVDTPGFQRPRQLLSWLQSKASNASMRSESVSLFLKEIPNLESNKFKDEVELLTPIMAGAGIIYVIDGSLPYTPEYEAEMTVLQWTGRPRMALINPIGGEQYVEQWQSALSQYFSVVRVFNPMTADKEKQITVLSAFAELHEPWRVMIEESLQSLNQYFEHLELLSSRMVVDILLKAIQHETSFPVPIDYLEDALQKKVKLQYQTEIRAYEADLKQGLQSLYSHHNLTLQSDVLNVDYPDLFDKDSWYMFGLDRKKIVGLAASAGAAAGAVIDVGVGGSSLMAGAVAGGLVSGMATLYATLKPEKLKVKGVPIAGNTLVAGPIKDMNFLFVLLGRSIAFLQLLSTRTHADRSVATVQIKDFSEQFKLLSKVDQVNSRVCCKRPIKG